MRVLACLAAIGVIAATAVGAHAGQGKRDLAGEKMCPMIYQPVCAQSGSSTRTFPNRCQAEGAGYAVVSQGPCGDGSRRILRFGTSSDATEASRSLRQVDPAADSRQLPSFR